VCACLVLSCSILFHNASDFYEWDKRGVLWYAWKNNNCWISLYEIVWLCAVLDV
jgi:hypothetical protein